MLSTNLKIMCILVFCGALVAQTGCNCATEGSCVQAKSPCATPCKSPCEPRQACCPRVPGELSASALPPNAKPGECFAKVWVPPVFKNVTERILVRDASETIEVVPAKYEWVEERRLVKEASTELEVVPAEFASREVTIQTNPGHTDWEVNKNATCAHPQSEPARDIFCLVSHPPESRTIQTQRVCKPPQVKTVCIPAEYETVRRQRLACAATTKRVCIPAEYDTIEKTVKVCDGRMAWKQVSCDHPEAERASIDADEPVTVSTKKVTAAANQRQTIATVSTKGNRP
jgi:hypothetical protein